jgi:hypothetical protein
MEAVMVELIKAVKTMVDPNDNIFFVPRRCIDQTWNSLFARARHAFKQQPGDHAQQYKLSPYDQEPPQLRNGIE